MAKTVTYLSEGHIQRTANARVLVVDDNVDLLKLIGLRLKPMRFELRCVESAEAALAELEIWQADLVVTDLQLPGMSGMELFNKLHAQDPLLPIIILTAHGTIPEAVEATQSGVSSYLTKPFNSEALIQQIQIALVANGFKPNANRAALVQKRDWRKGIITRSKKMEALLHEVETLAHTGTIVAFVGENGSGKDQLAKAMWLCGPRANNVLEHISCTTLPYDMLEAEIFGVAANPATNTAAKPGLLKRAMGGTLILSDYGEAPNALLHKIAAAMVDKQAQTIDAQETYKVDVQLLATTSLSCAGREAPDSIWNYSDRVEMALLSVPSLAERREDIPLIVRATLNRIPGKQDLQLSSKAMQRLLMAEFPGNIRQLINVVQQCARLSKTKIISEALVDSRLDDQEFAIQPLSNAHAEFERNYLVELLKVTNGNVSRAAELAKRNRTEFHRLLKKHQIDAQQFRV